MTKAVAEMFVEQVMDGIDEGVAAALADVQVYVVEGRDDPELREAIKYAEMPRAMVRRDFRGLYLGTTARAMTDEDTAPLLPRGAIVLNCQSVEDLADVRDTLGHEIGHALGMTEEEVENLGLA
jgi:predicted Zn-dependent protease with MMP-like domain